MVPGNSTKALIRQWYVDVSSKSMKALVLLFISLSLILRGTVHRIAGDIPRARPVEVDFLRNKQFLLSITSVKE